MRRWLALLVIPIMLLACVVNMVTAEAQDEVEYNELILQRRTVTFTTVRGPQGIELYGTSDCTEKMWNIYFGEIPRGETRSVTFYAKNIYAEDVTVMSRITSAQWLDWSAEVVPADPITLASGETQEYTLRVSLTPDAIIDKDNIFVLEFYTTR